MAAGTCQNPQNPETLSHKVYKFGPFLAIRYKTNHSPDLQLLFEHWPVTQDFCETSVVDFLWKMPRNR